MSANPGQAKVHTIRLWNGYEERDQVVIVKNHYDVQDIDTPIRFKGGVVGADGQPANVQNIGITVDGGGVVLTTGLKGRRQIPFSGTILSWSLIGDAAGSIQMDIKKSTYSGYPTTTSITASAKPTLSGVQKNTDSTLTGWTKTITAGDVLDFVIDSVSTLKQVTLMLVIQP